MRKFITLLSLALGLVLQAQKKDNFVGNWTANDGSVITIYIQDSSYHAKINDKVVLIQMEKKSDTQLYGGTYYDEKSKTEYEAKLKLTDSNTILLRILNGLSGKRMVWRRILINPEEKNSKLTLLQRLN
ncbi:hypothetical protein [Flavobacterium sp.]